MTMREPQAATQTQRVRALRNLLCGMKFLTLQKNCVGFGKEIFSRFAQSLLLNVVSHGVESGL